MVVRAVYSEPAAENEQIIVPHAGAHMAGIFVVGLVLALGMEPESVIRRATKAVLWLQDSSGW